MKREKYRREVLFILSVLFLSLWSCGMPDKASHNPMRVDIDARHEVSIFDIFERVELIPLETTGESIFGRFGGIISRLHYHDGVLYIEESRKIFAFDATTGEFLFKIDDRGQGPNEYLHIADFEIDRQRGKILVLDPIGRSLLEYDLNGRFIRRTRLPEIVHAYWRLRYLGNDIIAFWTFDGNNRLKLYGRSQGSIFQEHFPEIAEFRELGFNYVASPFSFANFFMCGGSVFTNNVYEVLLDGIYSIAYTWDFGRLNNCVTMARNLPEHTRGREESMALFEHMRAGGIVNYFFWRIGGNQTYRYAQIIRKNQHINLFHNIAKEYTYVFTEFSEGATFYPIFWSDEFVIGAGPFAGYREETIPDAILDERNLAIKRNICEFDNPVLIKYWFRR